MFRLDASLYHDCKQDAEQICSANGFNAKGENFLPENFVIACLYRNAMLKDAKRKVNIVSYFSNI